MPGRSQSVRPGWRPCPPRDYLTSDSPLVVGLPGVFRRTRQYIPAVGSELIAPAAKRCRGKLGEQPWAATADEEGRAAALSGFEFGGKLEGGEHLGVPEDRVAADAVLRDREDLQRVQLERTAR